MDKKFLAEYDSRERSAGKKFYDDCAKNKWSQYSPCARFGDLKKPVTHADPQLYLYDKASIWSQIPLTGTLIISLMNVSEKMCLNQNGFSPDDIPNLIKFAKETRKIKFGLSTTPLNYDGLDYLEPILQEFEPPLLLPLDRSNIFGYDIVKKYEEEFGALANIKYAKSIKQDLLSSGENKKLWDKVMSGRSLTYTSLKCLQMDDAVKELSQQMIDNPVAATLLFNHYTLLISSIFDSLTSNYNHGLTKLQFSKLLDISKSENVKIPEIGMNISQKLVPFGNSYEDCLQLVRQYNDDDLYKIMKELEQSVRKQQEYAIIKNKTELDLILDNVWSETQRMAIQKDAINCGISVTLGMISGLTGLPDIFTGLLPSLGFPVIRNYLKIRDSSISESIIRKIRPNGLVTIYDFKKKYKLN